MADESLVKFFRKYLKGRSEEELKQFAVKKGYKWAIIEEALKQAKAPVPEVKPKIPTARPKFLDLVKKYRIYIGLSITVLIILFVILLFSFETDCGFDNECFIQRASNCNEATLTQDLDGNTIKYRSTDDCALIITMFQMKEEEPEDVKALFEGKEMRCEYVDFDPTWVDHFLNSYQSCQGELVDAVNQLIIQTIRIEEEEAFKAESDLLAEEFEESFRT